jgi:hypothetical protein
MRVITKTVPVTEITVGQIIHNPDFPRLNRCLIINEIDASRPGRLTFTEIWDGERTSCTVYPGETVTRVTEEF